MGPISVDDTGTLSGVLRLLVTQTQKPVSFSMSQGGQLLLRSHWTASPKLSLISGTFVSPKQGEVHAWFRPKRG